MCGICGVLGPSGRAGIASLEAMTGALRHRGPDDSGQWQTGAEDGGDAIEVAFGHTRLSILDLSPLGHQPMVSDDGKLAIAYNGELYNHRELREELEAAGFVFRSQCDTEVLLQAYRAWGADFVVRLVGMFAFAIWDGGERALLLGRDRLGIKPLYYRLRDGVLGFASELGALRLQEGFEAEIDPEALGNLLRYGNCVGRQSIYRDTFRVLPAELVIWRNGDLSRQRYWSIEEYAREGAPRPFESIVDELESTLGDAVEQRMIADVPLGAFLSGGIDSTAVVALMQERAGHAVRTFSIGFEERGFDEAPFAAAVARHLGTEHTELYVGREEARDVALALPDLYDEPFADSSAIPTTLLSRLTRQHVTVSLSGDGGDELFGGYERYAKFARLARLQALPSALGGVLSGMARALGFESLASGLAAAGRAQSACELGEYFTARRFSDGLVRGLEDRDAFPCATWSETFEAAGYESDLRRMMLADLRTYLVDDILTKVDRASMSVGLEARVPLLDHRVVELALGLPDEALRHGGLSKAPLRELVYRRVPRALLERPKQGFGIPIHSLLGAELAEWKRRYLAPERIAEEGLLDPSRVDDLVARADRMGPAGAELLWPLLCFERWLARHHRGEELG